MELTRFKAEQEFKNEIMNESINTCSTPHYDSLEEYIKMLENTGFKIK